MSSGFSLSAVGAILFTTFFLSMIPQALAGGQDLGGGFVVTDEKPSPDAMKALLENFHQHREELLRAAELRGLVAARLLAVEPRLNTPLDPVEKVEHQKAVQISNQIFAENPARAYAKLKKIELEIRGETDCFDREGSPTVGSIFTSSTEGICISLSAARPFIDVHIYRFELLGLYMHELSHLYGSSEDQARMIQLEIRSLGKNYDRYFSFLQGHQDLDEKIQEIEAITTDLNEESPQLCDQLERLTILANQIFVDFNLKSQKILSQPIPDIAKLHALFVLATYTKDYCVPDQDLNKLLRATKFISAPTQKIQNLYPDPLAMIPTIDPDQPHLLSQYLLANQVPFEITFTPQNNKSALKKNLTQLQLLKK